MKKLKDGRVVDCMATWKIAVLMCLPGILYLLFAYGLLALRGCARRYRATKIYENYGLHISKPVVLYTHNQNDAITRHK